MYLPVKMSIQAVPKVETQISRLHMMGSFFLIVVYLVISGNEVENTRLLSRGMA